MNGRTWRLRHITFPQCIKGTVCDSYCQDWEGVRCGEGRERRAEGGGGGDKEEDDEEERKEKGGV